MLKLKHAHNKFDVQANMFVYLHVCARARARVCSLGCACVAGRACAVVHAHVFIYA